MVSHYITEHWEIDSPLRNLHNAADELKKIKEPMRLHGDAHFIWEDVCVLIELLGKVKTFVPDEKIAAARVMLESLDGRRAVLQAAE